MKSLMLMTLLPEINAEIVRTTVNKESKFAQMKALQKPTLRMYPALLCNESLSGHRNLFSAEPTECDAVQHISFLSPTGKDGKKVFLSGYLQRSLDAILGLQNGQVPSTFTAGSFAT